MNRRLPPKLYQRQYRTRGGYKKTVWCPRFVCWDGKRRTFKGIDDFGTAKTELSRLLELNRNRYDFDKKRIAATLYPWAKRYLDTNEHSPSLAPYTFYVNAIKAKLGDVPLADITHTRLLEYRRERKEEVGDSTINRELSSLRSILRLAYHDGIIAKLPLIPFTTEHNERTRTATPDEYRRILKALTPDARDFAEMIYEMGFRPAELLKITPAAIRPADKTIDMEKIRKKRGIRRVLPLSPRGWQILSRRARKCAPDEPVFQFTRHQVRTAFYRACKKLGIEGLWLYDLKATFATEKLRAGWHDKLVKEFTGHRSPRAFDRYVRPTMEDLKTLIQNGSVLATKLPPQSRKSS